MASHRALALAAFLVVPLLALAASPAEAGSYTDDFNGASPDGTWQILRPDSKQYSVANGALTLNALPGGLYGSETNNAANLFLRPVSIQSDFRASATLSYTPGESAYGTYALGGLLFYTSDDQYVHVVLRQDTEMQTTVAEIHAEPWPNVEVPVPPSMPSGATLVLERKGDTLTATASNGRTTTTLATFTWTATGKVGLAAYDPDWVEPPVPSAYGAIRVDAFSTTFTDPPPPPDTEDPVIESYGPAGDGNVSPRALVLASYDDNVGVDVSKSVFLIDGQTPKGRLSLTDVFLEFEPDPPYTPGNHTATLIVSDAAGNIDKVTWTFHVAGEAEEPEPVDPAPEEGGNTTDTAPGTPQEPVDDPEPPAVVTQPVGPTPPPSGERPASPVRSEPPNWNGLSPSPGGTVTLRALDPVTGEPKTDNRGHLLLTAEPQGPVSRVEFYVQGPRDPEPRLVHVDHEPPFEAPLALAEGNRSGEYLFSARAYDGQGLSFAETKAAVLLEGPRATFGEAVLAVVMGVVVAASASTVAPAALSLWDTLRGVAEEVTEEQIKERTAGRARRTYRGAALLAVLVGGATVLAALIAYPDATVPELTWLGYLQSLAFAGAAAALVLACAFGLEYALTRRFGGYRNLRVWWSGVVSLAATSLLASSPFGTTVHAEGEPAHGRVPLGRFMLALQFAVLALLLPFALLALGKSYDFGSLAVTAIFAMVATNLLPVKPLPGYSIWGWNKGICVGMGLLGLGGYVAWQVGFLSLSTVALLGAAAPLAAFALLAWPGKSSL